MKKMIGSLLTIAFVAPAAAGEKVELLIQKGMYGGQVSVACEILGRKTQCKLDTGANVSSIRESELTKDLETLGTSRYVSASGSEVICRNVAVPDWTVGPLKKREAEVITCPNVDTRTGLNILGLDLLRDQVVKIDYDGNFLEFSPSSLPADAATFGQDPMGHVLIPVGVGGYQEVLKTTGMVDTGASLTVVSLSYAEARPDQFTPVKEMSNGFDTHGNPLKSVLMIATLFVGGKKVVAEYVMAIDFTAIHKMAGPEVNFILGHNVLKQGIWSLDFPNRRWAVE